VQHLVGREGLFLYQCHQVSTAIDLARLQILQVHTLTLGKTLSSAGGLPGGIITAAGRRTFDKGLFGFLTWRQVFNHHYQATGSALNGYLTVCQSQVIQQLRYTLAQLV